MIPIKQKNKALTPPILYFAYQRESKPILTFFWAYIKIMIKNSTPPKNKVLEEPNRSFKKGHTVLNIKKNSSTKARFILITYLIPFFIFTSIEFFIYRSYISNKNRYINEKLLILSSRIESTTLNLKTTAKYVFETQVNTPEVTALLEKAWDSPPEKRDPYRQKLYTLMEKEYNRIVQFNFRQLHFHFPDTTSFLRMHSPSQFGDELKNVRQSIYLVNRDLKPFFGFEEGRIVNGYRFVYPLFHDGRHVGSAEVSFSIEAFSDIIETLDLCSLRFAMDKNTVQNIVFSEKQNNYSVTEFSDLLMYDNTIVPDPKFLTQLTPLAKKIAPLLQKKEDFGIESIFDGKNHLHLFKSIKNLANQPVAWIIVTTHDDGLKELRKNTFLLAGVSILIFFFIILTLRSLYIDRQRLKFLATTDNLTKVSNLQFFYEQAIPELARAIRHGYPVSIILFDIDFFKAFNDTYGHAEGDRVLVEVANTVRHTIRESDILSRWGGEEFTIFLSHTTKQAALHVAEKIRSMIETSVISKEHKVTISLGVSTYILGDTIDSMITRADTAMYEAKHSGRNCVRCQ